MRPFIVLALLTSFVMAGQGLTRSAEGESTVLMHGAAFGFNLTKTQLSFGINNLQETIGGKSEPLFGISAEGENKEGLANLFSSGDFVPAASLEGLAGYSFSNGEAEETPYYQALLFGYGGIRGSEFKRFTAFDPEDLSDSFIDETFRGGRAGIGFNVHYDIFRFGITYGYLKTNNFNLLTKKEYTWERTETQGAQTITEEKEITAYSGSYGEVEVNELNYDLIVNLPLAGDTTAHVLINPYVRSQLMSRNSAVLPNSTNLGCGFYFFKNNKFLGGFYTELPDVNNNFEKAKPVADRNLRAPMERMSFGIVAKFSLNSILF